MFIDPFYFEKYYDIMFLGENMAKNSNYLFKLDLLILSLLQEKDMYGYEIVKCIQERSNNIINAKNGTMYPIIYKLIEDEYMTSHTELVNNKARVYYHLEDKGKEYLKKITEEYDQLVKCIDLIVHGKENYERK